MIIEIKKPVQELEKEILTFIPVTHRYYKDGSYYINSHNMTIDPFTDYVTISVKQRYISIKLHFYFGIDCEEVICRKGGI